MSVPPLGEAGLLKLPVARGPVVGTWRPPGSKSLTQRWMLLAALAEGTSVIENALHSEDVQALAEGLTSLGASVTWRGAHALEVRGVAGHFPSGGSLDAREGGTPARFLMAAAAMGTTTSVVDGSARLRERAMRDGGELLTAMGASVRRAGAGELPVEIVPDAAFRRGGDFDVARPASSQFISAVALVAPWLERGLRLRVRGGAPSGSYVRLTMQCLRQLGARCEWDGELLSVAPGPLAAFRVVVEPDASSAAYGFALAAVVPGSRVQVPGLRGDSSQPDVSVIRALETLGARVQQGDGLSVAAAGALHAGELDATEWPDGSLAVMAAACSADGPVVIRGLGTLAGKESDRIEAMRAWITASGVPCERGDDWMRVHGPWRGREPVAVHTHRDHRVAMSAAVAGATRGELSVHDPRCVEKSWPGFWAAWADLLGA